MPLYLDSCALAKNYLPEGRSSQTVRMILGRSRKWGDLIISSFAEPEVVSAFAKYVRERPTPEQRRQALAHHAKVVDRFRSDFRSGFFRIVAANEPVFESATVLLRDAPDWNIGAADALHLATALAVKTHHAPAPLVFVTADRGLAAAAQAEQFPVFNPDWQPLPALEALAAPSPPSA